jgi:hypothetical protein
LSKDFRDDGIRDAGVLGKRERAAFAFGEGKNIGDEAGEALHFLGDQKETGACTLRVKVEKVLGEGEVEQGIGERGTQLVRDAVDERHALFGESESAALLLKEEAPEESEQGARAEGDGEAGGGVFDPGAGAVPGG